MKIISKYKDYYDYLTGIYGEDPKLILDRRDFDYNTNRFKHGEIDFITLFIAGYRIEGLYLNYKFYYGDDLKKLCDNRTIEKKTKYWWSRSNKYPKEYYSEFEYGIHNEKILNRVVKDDLKLNSTHNCAILLHSSMGRRTSQVNVEKWPILGDLGLGSYIQPEVIYQWLVNWLSEQESYKENQRGIKITNIDKILSKGFDLKNSFRPKKKN